jgi:hypothetical protein
MYTPLRGICIDALIEPCDAEQPECGILAYRLRVHELLLTRAHPDAGSGDRRQPGREAGTFARLSSASLAKASRHQNKREESE